MRSRSYDCVWSWWGPKKSYDTWSQSVAQTPNESFSSWLVLRLSWILLASRVSWSLLYNSCLYFPSLKKVPPESGFTRPFKTFYKKTVNSFSKQPIGREYSHSEVFWLTHTVTSRESIPLIIIECFGTTCVSWSFCSPSSDRLLQNCYSSPPPTPSWTSPDRVRQQIVCW